MKKAIILMFFLSFFFLACNLGGVETKKTTTKGNTVIITTKEANLFSNVIRLGMTMDYGGEILASLKQRYDFVEDWHPLFEINFPDEVEYYYHRFPTPETISYERAKILNTHSWDENLFTYIKDYLSTNYTFLEDLYSEGTYFRYRDDLGNIIKLTKEKDDIIDLVVSSIFTLGTNSDGDCYFVFYRNVFSTISDFRDCILAEAPLIEVTELIDQSFTYTLLGFTIKISESNATIISGKYHFGFEIVD